MIFVKNLVRDYRFFEYFRIVDGISDSVSNVVTFFEERSSLEKGFGHKA